MKKSWLSFGLMVLLALSSRALFGIVHAEAEPELPMTEFSPSDFRNQNYVRKLATWRRDYDEISLEETTSDWDDFRELNPTLNFRTEPDYSEDTVVRLAQNDVAIIAVEVPETGLYELGFDFRMPEPFYTIPTISLKVNGETLFNESSSLELEVAWEVEPLPEEKRYNRYGNEMLPRAISMQAWNRYIFDDYNSRTAGPYLFLLQAGENMLEFRAENLSIDIGSVIVRGASEHLDYATYLAQHPKDYTATSGEMILIQGQDFSVKNDLEIKSSYYKDSAMTPYAYKHTVLNQLDGGSMSRGGSRVTYLFQVEKSGLYHLGLKVLHQSNPGIVAGKTFYVDGEIPFKEWENVTFDTNKNWENVVLGANGEPDWVYLTAGSHTLTIESSAAHMSDLIDRLQTIMDHINRIGLKVQTITGGNPSDALDWNILKYLPYLQEDLLGYADELEAIYQAIEEQDQGLKTSPQASALNVAAKQLRRVSKTPNKLGSKLPEFSEGSGSAYQLIGNVIGNLLNQPLSIDQIYLFNECVLPDPRASFFVRLWDGIKSFFYSFFDTRYNQTVIDEDTLEVWVGQSSLYLDIIQSMIDQGFTKETGIKVKCSVLADNSKIILANATSDNPDVVLSIDTWVPYSYALRGMLADLSSYVDFQEVASHHIPNNFTTLIFEEGVYGLPETQSVYMLYYRKDILNYLGLEPPSTWGEVIGMLPILQSHRMNFYHPLGGDSAFKGYGMTTPLIYQFGGEIYTEDGISTTLKETQTVNAIRFMTNLFTIYDLPLQVSSFFEHFRSGDIPIGIATVDLYLQLKYAAPELSGQWGVIEIPGMDSNQDGTIERYASAYGKASILFENSLMKREGWELIKWWNETSTQIEFMQNIKTNLGEKFLIISANMDALAQSVWDEDIKQPMLRQAIWARTPAITPGSYIVERELSNIWNKVVIDLLDASVAINESIPRITRELNRKFAEFGYKTSTDTSGKSYLVPMNSNIRLWIGDDEND